MQISQIGTTLKLLTHIFKHKVANKINMSKEKQQGFTKTDAL